MNNTYTLLIVDDEVAIQRSLKRSFFGLPYIIHTASNASEALSLMEQTQIDLIISDFKMPGMDGVDFLNIVKIKYPGIIRILISGFIDKDKLMDALFQFNVTSLLPKPWDDEILHKRVKTYLDLKTEVDDITLWKNLNSHHMESMLLENPAEDNLPCDFKGRCPGIYCGLLHLYNSEYYNGRKETDIEVIKKHFSPESIESLIQRSEEQIKTSLPNLKIDLVPSNIELIYNKLGINKNDDSIKKAVIHPSMLHVYRYITFISDRLFYFTREDEHFFLNRTESGEFSFNISVHKIFKLASFFFRLWNIADQFLEFSLRFVSLENPLKFENIEDSLKILFILDYYLEKNDSESLEIIEEKISKDLFLQRLLERR